MDLGKDGVAEMYEKFQVDSRTFLHLWRLDIQATLRDSKCIDTTRQKRDRWSAVCSHGQAVLKELAGVLGLWVPPLSLRGMLRWNVRNVEPLLQFLQLLVLLIEEEMLSWLTKGQWVPSSDNSVKDALMKVIMLLR